MKQRDANQSLKPTIIIALIVCAATVLLTFASASVGNRDTVSSSTLPAPATLEGCVSCHSKIEPMHKYGPTGALDQLKDGKDAQGLSCTACHGGNPVAKTKDEAHVRPRFPKQWQRDGKYTGANPERTNALLEKESSDFVRFVNPGDLRVAAKTCGECHNTETYAVARSMMTHGAMLWGAALYNNGGFPLKDTRFGESYSAGGAPQSLIQIPKPSQEQKRTRGFLELLDPLPDNLILNQEGSCRFGG